MLKVITDSATEINVQNVTSDFFIGVRRGSESKGLVTREKYHEGNYKIISSNCLTEGNGYSLYNRPNLHLLLETLIDNKFEVFVFDTSKELFTWLAAE